MQSYICTTCGTQYAPTDLAPETCAICIEERQFVGALGQHWTTLDKLRKSHFTTIRKELQLIGLGISPQFGIGQRALLVQTNEGNLLWDCISLVDPSVVDLLNGMGGVKAIAISHPHYYTSMVEWSRALGDVPVHLHRADREWVMREDECLEFWEGESKALFGGLTLVRAGGHYEGGAVLHVADTGDGKSALLAGDLLQVVPDGLYVSFMRSYPNFIPLSETSVRNIGARLAGWEFDSIYGAWWDRVIAHNGNRALEASISRYTYWLNTEV